MARQRRDDRHVIGEDREVRDVLGPGFEQRECGRRSGRLESDREEDHVAVRVLHGDPERVEG